MVLYEIILQPDLIYLNTSPRDRGYHPPTNRGDYNVGITVPLSGQHVQKLKDYKYLLQPSGTIIEIDDSGVTIILPVGIKICESFFSGYGIYGNHLNNNDIDRQLNSIDSFLDKASVKQDSPKSRKRKTRRAGRF